ncbi:MAG: L-threonylcarbamoyladenylate synthase [Brevinematia bacterium]
MQVFTRIIRVRNEEVEREIKLLREVALALRNGEVVAFPTETVYGLGANATNSEAVKKIFELKNRPSDNPLIVHVSSKEEIGKCAVVSNEVEETIINTLMPGPITVILRKKEVISPLVTAGLDTVGIRVPYNTIAQKLIELSGVPVCAPSANISGKPSATDSQTVIEEFSGRIPFIIDGGRTHIGIESTVVMVKEEERRFSVLILRPGFVTKEDIEEAINTRRFSKPVEINYSEEFSVDTPLSPGQKYRHYSPVSHVVIVKNIKNIEPIVKELRNGKIGILGRPKFLKEVRRFLEYINVKNILEIEWCKYDLIDCARNLFFAYRMFDRENAVLILVENLEESGIGYSIMNRVKKSATYIV